MRIFLKEDWDIPVQPPGKEEKGHFVGRDREVSLLINEISRRNQGAILVSGYRGVGKTSLVYKALRSPTIKNVLPVLINATHLEPEDLNGEEIKYAKQVLTNLIRRLYSSCKLNDKSKITLPSHVFQKIEKLYKKAVAAEYKSSAQEINSEDTKLERISSFEYSIFSDKLHLGIWAVSYTIAAAIAAIPIPNDFNWLKGLLTLLFAFPIPLGINLSIDAKKIESKTDISKFSAEELYTMDNNVGNLVFDLEEIHRELSRNKLKVIYVVDELDKMEDMDKNGGNQPAYTKIFKHFKNLFTLSSALFIFIGGEEVYDHFTNSTNKPNTGLYRSKEYTYFNTKYFLSRPNDQDVNRFFNEIHEELPDKDVKAQEREYEVFKRFLIFSAQSDYYDLIQRIKDQIIEFKGSKPIIETTDLQGVDLLKADLQKALSIVFYDKYAAKSPSRWNENENIIRELYIWANTLVKMKLNDQVTDDKSNSLASAAKRDLNYFCYRLKLLDRVSETIEDPKQTNITVRIYKFKGNFGLKIPDELNFKSEIEGKFLLNISEFTKQIGGLNRLYLQFGEQSNFTKNEGETDIEETDRFMKLLERWGVSIPQWNELKPIYQKMRFDVPPYPYNREEIEGATLKAIQAQDTLTSNSAKILSNIVIETFKEIELQSLTLNQNENLFSGPLLAFRQSIINMTHFVVFDKEYKRQILFISSIPRDIIEKNQWVFRENSRSHLVVLTNPEEIKFTFKNGVMSFPFITNLDEIRSKSTILQKLRSWILSPNISEQESKFDNPD